MPRTPGVRQPSSVVSVPPAAGPLVDRGLIECCRCTSDNLAGRIIRPVTCSKPLVEASWIQSKAGAVVVLTNWSGKPIKDLKTILSDPAPKPNASLASGAKLVTKRDGDRTVFTFELNVADVLILR